GADDERRARRVVDVRLDRQDELLRGMLVLEFTRHRDLVADLRLRREIELVEVEGPDGSLSFAALHAAVAVPRQERRVGAVADVLLGLLHHVFLDLRGLRSSGWLILRGDRKGGEHPEGERTGGKHGLHLQARAPAPGVNDELTRHYCSLCVMCLTA